MDRHDMSSLDDQASRSFEHDVSSSRREPDVIRLHEDRLRSEERSRMAAMAEYMPRQPRSLSGIATRAFFLGVAASAASVIALGILFFADSPAWRPPFFVAALATFHFLEFWTTAEANTRVVTTDSFLLTANWPHYAIAHSFGLAESLVVSLFFPDRSWAPWGIGPALLGLGLLLTLVGQLVRSLAMLHAGASFNHEVQWVKADSHVLVTNGVYAFLRHPSYFGFFYWGIGTQLVLGNVISFLIYAGVLWWFFDRRIRYEEATLVAFFKDDYVRYKSSVGVWIPFIR